MEIHRTEYLGSFASLTSCPRSTLPEYAFIGRSNVGKSSLINMLCNKKDLAHVSNSPGKTKTINLFKIDNTWMLADLPGYGYAKVSKSQRGEWKGLIGDYLMKRDNLMTAFVLLDLRLPLQDIDRQFVANLGEHRVPFCIVYTKADKITRHEKPVHIRRIEEALLEEWTELPLRFQTSAVTKEGRDELLHYIGGFNMSVAGRHPDKS